MILKKLFNKGNDYQQIDMPHIYSKPRHNEHWKSPYENKKKKTAEKRCLLRQMNRIVDAASFIVCLDLDRCLIGDYGFRADQMELERRIGYENPYLCEQMKCDLLQGLLRPGVRELICDLCKMDVTICIYTYSTRPWATKVINAITSIIGPFVDHIFARDDCEDEHPEFVSQKSLAHVADYYGVAVCNVVIVDDNNTVAPGENLIQVPHYLFSEFPQPFANFTEEVVTGENPFLIDHLHEMAVGWGIVEPNFRTAIRTIEQIEEDNAWIKAMEERIYKRNQLHNPMPFVEIVEKIWWIMMNNTLANA